MVDKNSFYLSNCKPKDLESFQQAIKIMEGVYVYLITISSNSGGTKSVSKFSGEVTLLR